MCMSCNKQPRPTIGNSSSSRQPYKPTRRIVGTGMKRATSVGGNKFGSPKIKINFAPKHR